MNYQQAPRDRADVPEGWPPGWYPDPGGAHVLRWWDGRQWAPQPPLAGATAPVTDGYDSFAGRHQGLGQHRRQASPEDASVHAQGLVPGPPTASLSQGEVSAASASWAWVVASAPLVMLGFAVLSAALAGPRSGVLGYVLFGVLVADIVAFLAAWKDVWALTAAGDPIAGKLAWWCLLTPWAYLAARAVKRADRSNADLIVLAASLAVWLLIIVVSTPAINSVITDSVNSTKFHQTRLEADIASGIKAKSGFGVTVSCPQVHPKNPGSQFQCAATAGDGFTILVTVTIRDRSGGWTWHTIGR